MAYPLPVVRRRKKRRLLWLVSIGSIVFLLALLALRFIDDRNKSRTYLDAAREATATFEALAVRADAIVSGLEEADRPSLLLVLEETTAEAAAAENSLVDNEIPNSLATPGAFLTAAVAAWRDGLTELQMGVELLLVDAADVAGQSMLSAAFLDLRVGDRAYQQFMVLIADEAGERPFPEFAFVGAERELRYDAALVTKRLAAVEGLIADHDIALADVRFDPRPTGDREGRAVIPFSTTLNLEVSVVNRGNEPESDVPVRMRLVSLGGDIVDEDTQIIAFLGPGEAVNLLFLDLPVEPGEFYEIILNADLATDEDLSSNEYAESFYRNDST